MPIGSVVYLEFDTEDGDLPIEVHGRVVHVGDGRLGIEFIDLTIAS